MWVRSLDSVETRRLPGTEAAGRVAWSPDGNWIAFYADGKLKKVSPRGGPPQTIAAIPGFLDAAWGPDGDIIFRPSNRAPLFRIRDSGGSPQPLTTLNPSLTENSHRFPEFLPGTRLFLFVARCGERANNALYIGSLDSPGVTRVMPAQSRVSYIPAVDGRPQMLVYFRDGALVAQRFRLDDRTLIGEAAPLFEQVSYNAPSIEARFRVSADGRVVVVQNGESEHRRFIWFNRSGEELGVLAGPAENSQPRLSPQGDRVLFSRPDAESGNRDVWALEIGRGIMSRLTTHSASDWYPVWSPDGRQVLFGSDRDGGPDIMPYLKTSMDPGSNESRLSSQARRAPLRLGGGTAAGYSTNVLKISCSVPHPAPLSRLPSWQRQRRKCSRASRPTANGLPTAQMRVGGWRCKFGLSTAHPPDRPENSECHTMAPSRLFWGPSGREIFYLSADGSIFFVDLHSLGQAETLPTPVRLFRACPTSERLLAPAFDTRDGQRFLVTCRVEPPGRFTALMNWTVPSTVA